MLIKPGSEGGLNGEVIEYDILLDEYKRSFTQHALWTREVEQNARQEFCDTLRCLKKAARRRDVPPHFVLPAEV